MPPGDLLLVGRVARAHGTRGQVIVNPETDFAESRFKVGTVVALGDGERITKRTIREVRFHQGRPIIGLDGVETMTAAESLAGAELWLPESSVGPLPEGTFYRHDLVGCDVRGLDGEAFGRVSAVQGPIDRSLLVVDAPSGELLIPMVGDICVRIDTAARTIVVNPPAGLLELNAKMSRPT